MNPEHDAKDTDADVRDNPPTGKDGKADRPLAGRPEIGKDFDLGFRKPPDKSPWQDEGDPEVNG